MKKLLTALLLFTATTAQAETFQQFISGLKEEAISKGISKNLVEEAFANVKEPKPKVSEKLKNQPESTFSFSAYTSRLASDKRASLGAQNYQQNQEELEKIANEYGVPATVLVALWGVESYFGKLPGKFQIIPSLTTLAYNSHRPQFFRKELMAALKIVEEGHTTLENLTGSWAGAMGQCQFMPSSFLHYAADGNADGKKDIWKTKADVFASSANYLKKHGWKKDELWGQRVILGKKLPAIKLTGRGLSQEKPMEYWQSLGIYPAKKGGFNNTPKTARLFLPEGPSKKAYLIHHNFNVIMRWNNASYFAFSVLTLADKIQQNLEN